MSEIPQFTIQDLELRYDMEPTLDDIFVEGTFDKDVIEQVIAFNRTKFRAIYNIDAINIPGEMLASQNLTSGNKQRVITLARELSKTLSDCKYTCVVDKDLDHWLGEMESTAGLKWTQHTSLEMYYFSEEFLKHVLITAAKCKIPDWGRFHDSLIETLRNLYALRLADKSLDLNLTWVNLDKSLLQQNGVIVFELQSYIQKLLNGSTKKKEIKDKFPDQFIVWNQKIDGDPRSYIRGHDFTKLIEWTIRSFKGLKEFASETVIERLYILSPVYGTEIKDLLEC